MYVRARDLIVPVCYSASSVLNTKLSLTTKDKKSLLRQKNVLDEPNKSSVLASFLIAEVFWEQQHLGRQMGKQTSRQINIFTLRLDG